MHGDAFLRFRCSRRIGLHVALMEGCQNLKMAGEKSKEAGMDEHIAKLFDREKLEEFPGKALSH